MSQEADFFTGIVKCLVEKADKPPFGFIKPDDKGADYYFNEAALGEEKSWADFAAICHEHEVDHDHAPVVFRKDPNRSHSAVGVVAVKVDEMKKYDTDHDHKIDQAEWERFMADHPHLEEASQTKRERAFHWKQAAHEMEKEAAEAEAKRRDEVFGAFEEKEEAIYKRRDEANAKAAALRAEGEKLWGEGKKNEAKQKQAEARTFREEAVKLKREAEKFDWEKNEAMHKYVMENEHEGRAIDGTWIDLHGLNLEFSLHVVSGFLHSASDKGLKEVQVIYGAGHHSGAGGPVIKGKVQQLIRDHPPEGLRKMTMEVESPGSAKVFFADE